MIDDWRNFKDFKIVTFSGYKKNDVINAFLKGIDSKNTETACNWLIECILSGYTKEIWDKLSLYYSKNIHINNIAMIKLTYKKNICLNKHFKHKTMDDILMLRNNQSVINIMIVYTILLISSPLNIKYANVKIKKEDFNLNNLQSKLQSQMNILPDNIVNLNEPPELQLICNEILHHLQSKLNCYDKIVYWIHWIIEWEKINIKNKISWEINMRNVDVKDKYKNDIIWIIWDLIKLETDKKNKFIKENVDYLYKLYIDDFDKNKRNKRLPYILNCVSLLSCNIKENDLIKNSVNIIQAQCNYHNIINSKKIYEKKGLINKSIEKIVKKEKKEKNQMNVGEKTSEEKTIHKLKDFNDIDRLLILNNI